MSHRTKTVILNGEKAKIDVQIVPLIELLNSIPGINTFTCCQGYFNDPETYFPLGYVMFSDCDERRVLQLLTGIYRQMNKQWRGWQAEHRRRFDKGERYKMHEFEFELKMGNGWIMAWGEGMFDLVLQATQTIAKKMEAAQ